MVFEVIQPDTNCFECRICVPFPYSNKQQLNKKAPKKRLSNIKLTPTLLPPPSLELSNPIVLVFCFLAFLHFVVKDSRTQLLLWSVGMKTRKRSKLFSSTGFLDSIYNNCAYRFWGGFGCNLSSHWFLGKKIVCFIFVFEATI